MTKTKTGKQLIASTTLTTLRERTFELVAALKVIALTPATAQYLRTHDPKALAQVIAALGLDDADITAIIAGPRPGSPDVDFIVTQDGSVFMFDLNTVSAQQFTKEHISVEGWQWLGTHRFAVDHRLAPGLVAQLREDGFSVVVR